MANYRNPLHTPVPSGFYSQYTSLFHANPVLEPPFQTSLPSSYKRVPQTRPSKSKLFSSFCRSSAPVPVMFELIGAPSHGLGIPMRELVVRSGGALERMIVDCGEPVGGLMSGSLGIRSVFLKIMWPGYDHVDWCRSLDLFSSAGPVTRGQLAVQIASAFFAYASQMATQTPSPGSADWRFGSTNTGCIAFERLVLVALWNTGDDDWMAEIYVDTR